MSRTPRNICECHCGTRIDINPKLVEEREVWREKCLALEEHYRNDIANIKQKIYKECSMLMEKQFKTKEDSFKNQLSKKNAELHTLNIKLQNAESKTTTLHTEFERMHSRYPSLQDAVRELEQKLQHQRRINADDIRHLRQGHAIELQALEQERNDAIAKDRKNYEAQLYHLRHQISDFESKYKLILPEVEKLRTTVNSKTNQNEQLKKRLRDLETEHDEKVIDLNRKMNQLRKPDLSYELKTLQRELEERNKEIQKLRSDKLREVTKTEIKYETVYVDRPVQVEKIVERVVEVQKIVKEFVQPKQPVVINEVRCNDQDSEDYQQLVVEVNNRTKFIGELQNQLTMRDRDLQQYERVVADYERNIEKYKNERVKLASTIGEKNREIESLEHRLQSVVAQVNSHSGQDEPKIIVNVKKDGTYTSSVEAGHHHPSYGNTRATTKQNKKDDKRVTVPVGGAKKK